MLRNNVTIETCDLSNCIEFIKGESHISVFFLIVHMICCLTICLRTHFRYADSNLLIQIYWLVSVYIHRLHEICMKYSYYERLPYSLVSCVFQISCILLFFIRKWRALLTDTVSASMKSFAMRSKSVIVHYFWNTVKWLMIGDINTLN